jgi:hypothetical protein
VIPKHFRWGGAETAIRQPVRFAWMLVASLACTIIATLIAAVIPILVSEFFKFGIVIAIYGLEWTDERL